MVADADKCFRVSGIPDEYTESQIAALLTRELHLDDDALVRILSLARSPLRPDEWIATVSLSQIPTELSERGQQHIDVPPTSSESRGPRRQVVLDSHFEGFTPLHTAKDDECHMDIVALSGLNGHAFGSFKAKGGSHMWLRDALPLDFLKARIFIYGYDTSPDKISFQNVWDLESTFRHRLRMLRARSDSTRKPFVIVAHSLGGIIAKAAVTKMADSTDEGDIAAYRSLRGILFFGVPSQGMDIESLVPMMPVSETRTLLISLDKNNSPTLRELGESFPRKIKELQDFEAFNFYETRESPTAIRNDKGNWEMKGRPTVLVTPFSATQGKLSNESGHQVIALNRTHSEMIKFTGANDNDYEATLDCLRRIEQRIGGGCGLWPLHPLSRDEQDCLQSLSFPEQHSREFDPKINPAEGTCTWIREHENYCSWLATNSGLLWIMGPPGAGKSTLMKFLVKVARENQRSREIITVFFVHGPGSENQRSHLGVYRSLLHQILPHCPKALASLTKAYKDRTITRGSCGYKWSWEEEELRECFVSTVLSESHQRPITVFIDALDEMGEDPAAKLIADFQRLQSRDDLESSTIRLCFSCRYYPNLVEKGSLSVAMEEENSEDINSLIETHAALTSFGPSDTQTITELITKRANGIFQWVSLVLDEVMRLRRGRKPATAVIARIKEVPGTLKGIYDALLIFENEDDRRQTLKLFQWILFSYEELNLEDLRQALAIDANMTHNDLGDIRKSNFYYEMKDMPTVIRSLSRGLARVTQKSFFIGEDYLRAETIHQSVNDYLLQSGLKELAQSPTESPEGLAHFQLSRSCIRLLQLISQTEESEGSFEEDIELCSNSSRDTTIFWYPLCTYAQEHWLNHVVQVERYGIDQRDLLDHLLWRKHCGTLPGILTKRWNFYHHRIPDHSEAENIVWSFCRLGYESAYRWNPVHLFALTGINSALEKIDQAMSGIYCRMDRFEHTTLLFALAGGNDKFIASSMSILTRQDVCNDKFAMTPLLAAVIWGREDCVQAFITEGADVDQMSKYNSSDTRETFSPLEAALDLRNEKMVRRLLSAGADPTIIIPDGHQRRTVIHQAMKRADKWSTSILPLLIESTRNLYPAKKLPNLLDQEANSTLFYAIQQENAPLVQLLLDSGACQDHLDDAHIDDNRAFHAAAERGLEEMVKLLLSNGINPNANSFDISPLHCAAENGHSSVVRLLLDAGARPTGLSLCDEDEYSCLACLSTGDEVEYPFRYFARMSHSESTQSRSFWSGNYNKTTPLEMAMNKGHASVVQAFLDVANTLEADTKAKVNEIWSLPWEWYTQMAVQNNFPDVVEILLNSNIDPNTFASSGKPLLHIAVGEGFVDLARILLHHGADPTLTDVSGVTALHRAIGSNHLEIMRMLLDWRDDHGRTLIMLDIFTSEQIAWLPLSARRDRPSWVIQQVLRTEYDFNVKDNKGLTALSYAVIENMPEIVDALLDHGRSDPNMQSLQGETVLMRAASAGYETILQRLLACPLTDIAIEDEDGLTAVDHARMAGNSTAVALLRKKQDELLAQHQNTLAIETLKRGRAWLLRTGGSTSMMGTLRRRPY